MAGTEARAKAREAGTRACEAEPGRARVTFRRALRSEAVRMRRSPLVVLHVALAVALGALAGAYFAFSGIGIALLGNPTRSSSCSALGAPLLAGICLRLGGGCRAAGGRGCERAGRVVEARRAGGEIGGAVWRCA